MSDAEPLKILITAPVLDEQKHVSGISTVVRQIIARSRYRCVHFDAGRRDGEIRNAAWLIRQATLPARFFQAIKRGNFDVVHINTTFNAAAITRDFALLKTARLTRRPIVLHVHGGAYLTGDFESSRLESLAAAMLNGVAAVIVLSKLEKSLLEKRYGTLPIRVLENAVAPFENKDAAKIENSVIFLGRLHESKGLREIIGAARRLKAENVRFTFRAFGAGDLQKFFVREMTAILGGDFHFGGVVSGTEKHAELARAGVFVLPSRYGEGLPMALLEAMAAGCIVIAAEMASVGAVIENGVNGLLIAAGDGEQLAAAMRTALSGDYALEKMRVNARRTVAEKFNLNDYIENLEKLYDEVSLRTETE